MAWIESHTVLPRHRKVAHAALLLDMDPAHFLGCLHCLWHSALEQQEDGDLTRWPDAFTANAASFKGDPTAWLEALRTAGWLDGSVLHDWLDYAGRFLESRYRTADPEKLVAIWAKHGKVYKLTETQLEVVKKIKAASSPSKDGPPNPPTKPTIPNQLPRKEGGLIEKGLTTAAEMVEDFQRRVGTTISPKEAAEQDRLLNLRMPFGEFKGTHISSLPADRARWLLTEWSGRFRLGAELKKALELCVKIKDMENSR